MKHSPCYVTNGTDYLVQVPADNQWGFSLCDEDQSWPGGFGSGWSTWEVVPTVKVPKRIREALGWIIDEFGR